MHIVRISAVWCSSCIVTYSDFLKFKEEHAELPFLELDYDRDAIQKYHVTNILPVIIFEKNGREVARIEGEYKKKNLEAIYEKVAL